MSAEKVFYATGRRKTSSARVFLKPGRGEMTINGQPAANYMKKQTSLMVVKQPLETAQMVNKFDAFITVNGGGETGQAGAIRLGIARALTSADSDLRPPLKKAGFLTRDSRMVERKKYGKHGARRSCQFSKR